MKPLGWQMALQKERQAFADGIDDEKQSEQLIGQLTHESSAMKVQAAERGKAAHAKLGNRLAKRHPHGHAHEELPEKDEATNAVDDFIEEEELRSAQKPGALTWLKDPDELDEGDEEAQMSPGIDGGALDEFEAILPSENSPRRPKISPKRMQEISVRPP